MAGQGINGIRRGIAARHAAAIVQQKVQQSLRVRRNMGAAKPQPAWPASQRDSTGSIYLGAGST
jgi:hypothetical protein